MPLPFYRPFASPLIAAAAMCLALGAPALADIRINEVESDGSVNDFIELVNTGGASVNVDGYVLKDSDDTHVLTIPGGTSIAAGGFLAVDTDISFGLGSNDTARVFLPGGATLLDSYSWTAHASTTYGRCPDGTGAFVTTTAVTKGASNACPATASPWPGSASITIVDAAGVLGDDVSGLDYEGTGTKTPGVLWAVDNGSNLMLRLLWNGTQWVRDTANGWSAGKVVHYPTGAGRPDAEGITLTDAGAAGGVFVSSESDVSVVQTSRISILRYDVSGAAATLTATMEWNLTADLPTVGFNAGAESVEWIPDTYLVDSGFVDEKTGQPYDPADYPGHGTGLFFIGLEANGILYGYALNQTTGGFDRLATFASGFTTFGALHWDDDQKQLWVVCDNNCDGRSRVFRVGVDGHFALVAEYARPTAMPNVNNEGFTFARDSECVAGSKPVYWADDDNTGGHVLRAGKINCTPPPPSNDALLDLGTAGLWERLNNASWLQIDTKSPVAIAAGDLDDDGQDEAIASFPGRGLLARFNNAGPWVKLDNSAPAHIIVGDLDGNGIEDLVADIGSAPWARFNNSSTWLKLHNAVVQDFAIGDFNGDGRDDLAVDRGSGGVWIERADSIPTRFVWTQVHTGNPLHLVAGDLDGDGKDELIADFTGSGILARYNNSTTWTLLNASVSQGLAVGNFDGTNRQDLLVDYPSGVWLFANNTRPWRKIHTTSPTALGAADLDSSGKDEEIIGLGGAVWVRYNDTDPWRGLIGRAPDAIVGGGFD